jgi:16S rRNA A1518/A1519 N6-dimethyltransferase RsmA/KsgA/DIM1 with predicted DNA glycosylase/AP lyase activity
VDPVLVEKSIELAGFSSSDSVFLASGDNGQLSGNLCSKCGNIVVAEPDRSLASYLTSLGLYRTLIIHAPPSLVLKDMPFNKLLALEPSFVDEHLLAGLLSIDVDHAVMIMDEQTLASFKSRNMLGTLLRASFNLDIVRRMPKSSFSPCLENNCHLVSLKRVSNSKDPIKNSLQLLMKEAGTVRGLLTRSCREYFGYTLAEAQEAVKMLDTKMLRKRFDELNESEFKDVHSWLKLG